MFVREVTGECSTSFVFFKQFVPPTVLWNCYILFVNNSLGGGGNFPAYDIFHPLKSFRERFWPLRGQSSLCILYGLYAGGVEGTVLRIMCLYD